MKRYVHLVGFILIALLAASSLYAGGAQEKPKGPVDLKFFFPVQVAGPQAKLMSEIVDEFNKAHPDIKVEAVYSGNYDQTVQKAITAAKGGNPPAVIVATSISLLEFLDQDLIEDIDQFMVGSDKGFTDGFFPGFMKNSIYKGKVWSVPFQRSIPALYWNKKHFAEVGLDPEKPPRTWDEVVAFAEKLVKRNEKGETVRWGYEDITEDTWTIQGLILQAGGTYANEEGTKAFFNTPEAKKAFSYWNTLVNEKKVMPAQRFYGPASQDFVAETASMMINSSGSFTFVSQSAKFPFGVTTMPGNVRNAFPTGGGNLYIFKGLKPAEKNAAWTFTKWMASPEVCARWTEGTGYIPAQKAAYNTQRMKDYMAKYPHYKAISEQLQFAEKEMAFYSNSQIRQTLKTFIADVLLQKVPLDQGLVSLQKEVDKILEPYSKK